MKQRKSKSRSQGDKYRPTGVHTEHGLFTARPAHESKEGSCTRQRVRNESPFPVDIVAKSVEESPPSAPRASPVSHRAKTRRKYAADAQLHKIFLSLVYVPGHVRDNVKRIYSAFINNRAVVTWNVLT